MEGKSKLCFIIPEYNRATPTHFSYLYDFIEKISEELDIFLIAEKGGGEPLKGVNRFYIQKFNWPILRIIENEIAIEWARWLGYKIFYVHYSFLSAYNAAWVARFTGGKVFYWNCGEPWKYKHSFLRAFFERLVYQLIHFLVTGTEGLKKKYAERYGLRLEKILVIPNYIDTSKLSSSSSTSGVLPSTPDVFPSGGPELKNKLNIKSEKVILFVHRLSKRKGAHYLPEILNELRDENVVIIIIGDGPERENLESRIKNYELWDKAHFLGWVPQKDLTDYYAVADVFIMPSDEEGFPHVLLESMAYGVSFVAFDVGGVREIIPSETLNFVVESGNVKLFTEKIKGILSMSDGEKTKLKSALSNHVLRYDISFAVKRLIEIIKNAPE